jgi:hypothetical protein
VKAELTAAIKTLATKSAATDRGSDAAHYAAAVANLMQALGMLDHMEREPEPLTGVRGEVGGTD